MLLSRSGGREFKPTRGHLFKGFGNIYRSIFGEWIQALQLSLSTETKWNCPKLFISNLLQNIAHFQVHIMLDPVLTKHCCEYKVANKIYKMYEKLS